jgi:DNA-binding Xre family transcriptional regulator
MLRWRIRQYLKAHGLSAYDLDRTLGRKLSPRTIYALARNEPTQIRLETLDKLLGALEALTGKPVGLSDLLEYQRD